MSELAARVAELGELSRRQIVVHCHHGGRSLKVAQWLRSQGFAKAQSMAGGIDDWALEIDRSLPLLKRWRGCRSEQGDAEPRDLCADV